VIVDSHQILRQDAQGASYLQINRDITRQKYLEEQSMQSQKLESLGQLAGGVAHDFNNLLTIVMGYAETILAGLADDDPLRGDVEEIGRAGDRASALTRQLLLFSRRQMASPVNLTLGDAVLEIERMLRSLTGENIELILTLDPDRTVVRADPGHIQQLLMNLVVNARDAMPRGGRLMIEVTHAFFDETSAETHLATGGGPYAVLSVSDNGTGMSPGTKARIFEPFFTTKPQGKGTGLGLSTVYGIVRESGGSISVYSEPGLGSTFRIYLPAVQGQAGEPRAVADRGALNGSETILLVEDEDALRKYIHNSLKSRGYTVLVSSNGREALAMAELHRDQIALLLSDVVMPEMGGIDLAEAFASVCPGVPVLLMSGYSVRMWREEIAAKLIQKPFSINQLLTRIRGLLDPPD
jgi:signal transduction histidine kinase